MLEFALPMYQAPGVMWDHPTSPFVVAAKSIERNEGEYEFEAESYEELIRKTERWELQRELKGYTCDSCCKCCGKGRSDLIHEQLSSGGYF
jgi:hypothetical protein